MRAVQLDHVEAQPRAALCRLDEGLLDPLQADRIEGDRRVPLGIVGDGRRRDRGPRQVGCVGVAERAAALPRPLGRGLAAGMGELDAELDRGHPGARPVDDGFDRRFVLVTVEAEAALGDAAVALDVGGFQAEQAGAGHGEHAVVDLVPGLGAAVDGRVLAHRRHDDAIGQGYAAKLDGCEELGGHDFPLVGERNQPLIDGPASWPSHSSIRRRAMESRRGMKNEPSLGRFSGLSSSRLSQRAASSSDLFTS